MKLEMQDCFLEFIRHSLLSYIIHLVILDYFQIQMDKPMIPILIIYPRKCMKLADVISKNCVIKNFFFPIKKCRRFWESNVKTGVLEKRRKKLQKGKHPIVTLHKITYDWINNLYTVFLRISRHVGKNRGTPAYRKISYLPACCKKWSFIIVRLVPDLF